MQNPFAEILKGKTVILGLGNTLRGDDGFGPALIERLKGNTQALCFDAGTAPENYAGKIAKENPDTVLIVDAAHLDLAPGSFRLLEGKDILKNGFTTHDMSPGMFMEHLSTQTKSKIYMLGVQPQNISLGSEMSDAVKKALDNIEKLITENFHA